MEDAFARTARATDTRSGSHLERESRLDSRPLHIRFAVRLPSRRQHQASVRPQVSRIACRVSHLRRTNAPPHVPPAIRRSEDADTPPPNAQEGLGAEPRRMYFTGAVRTLGATVRHVTRCAQRCQQDPRWRPDRGRCVVPTRPRHSSPPKMRSTIVRTSWWPWATRMIAIPSSIGR